MITEETKKTQEEVCMGEIFQQQESVRIFTVSGLEDPRQPIFVLKKTGKELSILGYRL
jgi:hypothetical protein